MCGIFGVFYSDKAVDDHVAVADEVLKRLAPANLVRGNKSFGYFAWHEACRFARKFTEPFDIEKVTVLPMKAIICHVRAPTSGDGISLAEVHPYETKFGYLFMNGILLNYQDPMFASRKTHMSTADTAYLAGNIDYHMTNGDGSLPSLPYAIGLARAAAEFEGQQACVFAEPVHGVVYLWRVMATLYFGSHPLKGYSVISSAKIPGLAEVEVKQGHIYRLDRNAFRIIPSEKFEYHSAYEANHS